MVLVDEDMVSSIVHIKYSPFSSMSYSQHYFFSRLVYRRRHFRDVLGPEHGSPYINIMTMCVKSSVLVVIFNGTYTALTFSPSDGRTRIGAYWIPTFPSYFRR